MSARRNLAIATAALLLGGCATFSGDGGTGEVNAALQARGITQQAAWIRSEADADRDQGVAAGHGRGTFMVAHSLPGIAGCRRAAQRAGRGPAHAASQG